MVTQGMSVKGQKRLARHIKKMENPELVFDKDFKSIAILAQRGLAIETPKMSGDTARGWQPARKLDLSRYVVINDKKTKGSKIPIVEILNDGRKEVRPIKAKKLYIPLTNRGRARDKSAVYGVDFILADKSKAVKGKKFIQKVGKKLAKKLVKKMTASIRRVHRGK